MKEAKILFLILFLAVPSLSEVLMLHVSGQKTGSAFCLECNPHIEDVCTPVDDVTERDGRYECVAGETIRKKIIFKNTKIELEGVIINLKDYLPKGQRWYAMLKDKMISNFLNDINKMILVNIYINVRFCYDINIYDGDKLIVTFETDGNSFYDRANKLMYYSKDDLLLKYWEIYEENHCR